MTAAPAAALDAAAAARVTLVLGATDTGKTALITRLAVALAERGELIGVVDADLGQSDVGPPTTVGLGLVRGAIERLEQAETVALDFLGITSPVHDLRRTVDATARLVRHALALGCRRVLVDTSGLVEGDRGRALKQLKIDGVAPDLLIALQRDTECEPILAAYEGRARPAIVRLPAAAGPPRSQAARRRERERRLAAHFIGAALVDFDLARVEIRPALDTDGLVVIEIADALVGLVGGDGWTLGLGWVRGVDLDAGRVMVETTVDARRVAAITIGLERGRAA